MFIYGINYDSRRVKAGDLFVALKGENHDGHQFIDEALRKGAHAIVAEQAPPNTTYSLPVTWIQVPDSRLALALLAAAYYNHPARDLSVVGVTGTCGKTTTTAMLQQIYQAAGLKTGLIGTVQVKCNGQSWPARLTTPDALELQRLLRLMADTGVSHTVMEVSSHGLAQKRADGINFQGAVFTNISPNHLDYHRDLHDYASTKWRLASLVDKGGFVLANGDDPFFSKMEPPNTVEHIFFGTQQFCHLRIHNIVLEKGGSFFGLKVEVSKLAQTYPALAKNNFFFHIPLPGRHNVFNAATAAATALLTGVTEAEITQGFKTFKGVERRLQFHQCSGLQVMDDTAMSPGSVNAVFTTLQELAFNGGDLVIVYAIRGRRGTRVNEDNGRTLAEWMQKMKIRHFFSTSAVNHVDEQNEVLPQEKEAFLRGVQEGGASTEHYDELEDALARAVEVAVPGLSTLLLLGAQGMDEGLELINKYLSPGEKIPSFTHHK